MSSGRKGKLFLMFSSSFGQCAFALGAGCLTAILEAGGQGMEKGNMGMSSLPTARSC